MAYQKLLICEGPCNGDGAAPHLPAPRWARHTAHDEVDPIVDRRQRVRVRVFRCCGCETDRIYGREVYGFLFEVQE
jgi:hypothetical protein